MMTSRENQEYDAYRSLIRIRNTISFLNSCLLLLIPIKDENGSYMAAIIYAFRVFCNDKFFLIKVTLYPSKFKSIK